ncbi:unnamed protein product [Heligmosomoides polygyrus]|uniref:MAM domain-containing protein n=1 Tax=Heligmosomoides polygyrus TaxID=6339 RepID=A0A3P8BI44_HELPZ|nr:unnamed protein product [Heligmosomoides polygyrus]
MSHNIPEIQGVAHSNNPVLRLLFSFLQLHFTVPHSVDPVSIRIEIGNLSSQDVILVDSLYYEGRICELVRFFFVVYLLNSTKFQPLDTEARTGDLVACEELTCDFNYNHSCFYKLNGFGSTYPKSLLCGLLEFNSAINNYNITVGYAYVGRNHVDDSTEVFVLESPKFEISSDASLTFDVYLRSYSPRLKVCIDSFDDCPYQSPPPSSRAFWHVDQSIKLNRGVRKVYFIATSVRQNQFLAVDRIRVVLDGKPCT